jgi:hypothetical protein
MFIYYLGIINQQQVHPRKVLPSADDSSSNATSFSASKSFLFASTISLVDRLWTVISNTLGMALRLLTLALSPRHGDGSRLVVMHTRGSNHPA